MKLSKNFKKLIIVGIVILLLLPFYLAAQDEAKEEEKSPYEFTIDYEVARTPVKNQAKTGTCWCFSTISFLESELLRMGKGEFDLSEMFVVRHTYPHKAENYIRLHGKTTYGQGGQHHDVIDQIKRHGIVPEDVYPGMEIEEKKHHHEEMAAVLRAVLNGVLKAGKRHLTPNWIDAFQAVLDTYLGTPPIDFIYNNKKYTPQTFAEDYLKLNLDDYIELTSYTHHPFYEKFRLEIPDNWTYSSDYYNIPISDLEKIIDHALKKGYSVAWDGDVSEKDFSSRKTGYAVVPRYTGT